MHPRTAAASGHVAGDTHFYAVVCYHLPEEVADQLKQIMGLNPDGQTYGQLAARDEFARALKISVMARENFLKRFMSLAALEPKQSDKRYVHTTADLLERCGDDVVFYSGCASSATRPDGVISLSKSDADSPMFWFSGSQSADHPGARAHVLRSRTAGEKLRAPRTAGGLRPPCTPRLLRRATE